MIVLRIYDCDKPFELAVAFAEQDGLLRHRHAVRVWLMTEAFPSRNIFAYDGIQSPGEMQQSLADATLEREVQKAKGNPLCFTERMNHISYCEPSCIENVMFEGRRILQNPSSAIQAQPFY